MASKKDHIDEIIRQKLSQIRPEFNAGSWDSFARKLDEQEAAEDELLREKLSQIKPTFSASSWDLLSEQLAEQEHQEDEIIRNKISKISPSYQEQSWQVLSNRIEVQNRRAQAILDYKFVELSMFLLLLFVFWQWGPYSVSDHQPSYDGNAPVQEQELEQNTTPQQLIDQDVERPLAAITTEDQELNNQESIARIDNNGMSQSAGFGSGTTNNSSETIADNSVTSNETAFDQHNKLSEPLPGIDYEAVYSTKPNPSLAALFQGSSLILPTSPSIEKLDFWPIADLAEEDDLLLESIIATEPKASFRFGFVGAPDYNRIITPPYSVTGQDTTIGFDRYALGYSGGFTIGIEKGRWEFELGALYAVRSYENIPVVALTGNFREGYEGVGVKKNQINTLNLPIGIRYNFLLNRKWRIYGLMGGGFSTILDANYFVAGSSAFNIESQQGLAPANPNSGARGNPRQDLPADLQRTPSGLLQGGDFWDNTSIYMSGGFGLERYISYRWSVFAQPTYQHSVFSPFRGIGPYQDKIHTMSILMGLKVKL